MRWIDLPSERYRSVWFWICVVTFTTSVVLHVASFAIEFDGISAFMVVLFLGVFAGMVALYPGFPDARARASAFSPIPRRAKLTIFLLAAYFFVCFVSSIPALEGGSPMIQGGERVLVGKAGVIRKLTLDEYRDANSLGLRISTPFFALFSLIEALVFRYSFATRASLSDRT